jgi:hypothetical protein
MISTSYNLDMRLPGGKHGQQRFLERALLGNPNLGRFAALGDSWRSARVHYPADRRGPQKLGQSIATQQFGNEIVGGGCDNFRRAPQLDQLSGAQDRDPVGQPYRFIHVVGNDHDRLVQLALNLKQLALKPVAGNRVESPERLVHQQHRRVRRQGTRNADLLLPAAQSPRAPIAILMGNKTDKIRQLVYPRRDPGFRPAQKMGHDADILANRHVRKKADILNDVAERPTQLEQGHRAGKTKS